MIAHQEPPGAADHDYPSVGRAWTTLALLMLAYVVSYLDRQILSLLVEPMRKALNVNDFQISLLQGFAFAVFFSFAALPLGYFADHVRRTWIVAGGIFLWSAMTIACGLATSFGWIFLARVGVGVGEAALVPAGLSLLADSFRPAHLVRATAIFIVGSSIGLSLAYFVGGTLIHTLSATPPPFHIGTLQPWQMVFVLIGTPGLILVPFLLMLGEPKRLGRSGQHEGSIRETVTYLWRRRGDYAPFYLCNTLLSGAAYSGMLWLPTHLIRRFGVSPLEIGVTLGLIQLLGSLAGAALGATLTERFQRLGYADANLRTVLLVSLALATGLCSVLMPTPIAAFAVWVIGVLALNGFYASIAAALQLMTPNRMRAANSALLLMIQTIGGLAVGTALIGALSDTAFPGRPYGIGLSIAIVGISAALASAVIAWRAMPRFAAIVRGGFVNETAPL